MVSVSRSSCPLPMFRQDRAGSWQEIKGGGGGVVGQEREVPTPRAKYFSSQSLFLVAIMSVEWEIGVCYIPTLEKTVLYTSDSIV